MRRIRSTKPYASTIAVAACTLLIIPTIAAAAGDATALAAKYNCSACHAVDKTIVGPAYKAIAAKYAGDAGAAARLERKVKDGGGGVWGPVPMPPNNVPDGDVKALVESILATK